MRGIRESVASLVILASASGLRADGLKDLPEWSREVVKAGMAAQAPEGVDAWVLLDSREVTDKGKGRLVVRTRRVVRVLNEKGLGEASYLAGVVGSGKVSFLDGWNLIPNGKVETFGRFQKANWADGHARGAAARFDEAVPGSVLVYDVEEVNRDPLGPMLYYMPVQTHPVQRWELILNGADLRLDSENLKAWSDRQQVSPRGVVLEQVRALPQDEPWEAHRRSYLPTLFLRATAEAPHLADWDAFARYTAARYAEKVGAGVLPGQDGAGTLARLQRVHGWLRKEMTYKQAYLTPERGWVPDPAAEIARKRYGDCKDLACLFLSGAGDAGFPGVPVLASMAAGPVGPHLPINYVFDHVMTAIPLKASLGLASEVETPRGRFLLVDPTARLTPLGKLPSSYFGRSVFICQPEGGTWVKVPQKALEQDALDLGLEGTLTYTGCFEGEVRFEEVGDAVGLRGTSLEGGPEALQKRLAQIMDLPGQGRLEVLEASDPLNLERPFTVRTRVRHPMALGQQGSDLCLGSWGLPQVPPPPVRPGRTRQSPLAWGMGPEVRMHARLLTSRDMKPLAPEGRSSTPLRDIQWQVKVGTEGEQKRVEVDARVQRKAWSSQGVPGPEALGALKADRAQVRRLLEDGLAFK